MNDGPRPKVTDRDRKFQVCRVELRELLGQFWDRHGLTPTEYVSLLSEVLASDIGIMLRCERVREQASPAIAGQDSSTEIKDSV